MGVLCRNTSQRHLVCSGGSCHEKHHSKGELLVLSPRKESSICIQKIWKSSSRWIFHDFVVGPFLRFTRLPDTWANSLTSSSPEVERGEYRTAISFTDIVSNSELLSVGGPQTICGCCRFQWRGIGFATRPWPTSIIL